MAAAAAAPKFINAPADVPSQSLEGLLFTRPDLTVLSAAPNVVVPKNIVKGRVAILCGGGSGHEPAHAGYVADGWLTAAVCGGVFASPSTKSVLEAIRHLSHANGNAGVLVLIKNYGGDVINFSGAATVVANETPEGQEHKTRVQTFVIGDDVAFGADHDAQRGVAGTVMLYKMLGAAARDGAPLEELAAIAAGVAPRMRTVGSSMSSCAVPGNPPTSTISAGEYELGLGIHGEPGKERVKQEAASLVVSRMLMLIGKPPARDESASRSLLPAGCTPATWWPAGGEAEDAEQQSGSNVVVFVNNLGATSDIEMNIIARDAVQALRSPSCGAAVRRVVSGRAMTALDMHGFSLTVLLLPAGAAGAKWLSLLDAPNPPLVGNFAVAEPPQETPFPAVLEAAAKSIIVPALAPVDASDDAAAAMSRSLVEVLKAVSASVAAHESALNVFDAEVGDGDIGSGAARACTAVLQLLTDIEAANVTPKPDALLGVVAAVVADSFAGTSGPLLGGFLASAAPCTAMGPTVQALCNAMSAGTTAIRAIGKAEPGERTMVDCLVPVCEAATKMSAEHGAEPLTAAVVGDLVVAAKSAAADAMQLPAKKGRARYSNGREVGKAEPGCELIVTILEAFAAAL